MTCQSISPILALMFLLSAKPAVIEGKPSFDDLKSNYPTSMTPQLAKQIGLSEAQQTLISGSTCATRMSWAFIQSGESIDSTKLGGCNWYGMNANGKAIIIRANTFKCYLDKIWGGGEGVPDKDSIKDKNGVIVFSHCNGINHVDLWEGCVEGTEDDPDANDGCVGHCPDSYFTDCSTITLFVLEECPKTTTSTSPTPSTSPYTWYDWTSSTTSSTTTATSTTTSTTTPHWTTPGWMTSTWSTSPTTASTTTTQSTTTTPPTTLMDIISSSTTVPTTTTSPSTTTTASPTTTTTASTTTASTTTSEEPPEGQTTTPAATTGCSEESVKLNTEVTIGQQLEFRCTLDPPDDDYVITIFRQDASGYQIVFQGVADGGSLSTAAASGNGMYWCEASKPQQPTVTSGSITISGM